MMTNQATKQPNIIFLLTDDQRWDAMGCAGNPVIQTPHLDHLARDGMRFTNAFATTPICAASRASIFTGLYERTHQFTFCTPPLADAYVDFSYPVRLRAAGYRTGFVGKFGINVQAGARERMFDYFDPVTRTPYFKPQPDGSERHATDIEGEKAIAFLDTVQPDAPFCLSVSFNAPHAEDRDPKQYYWQHELDDLYGDDVITPPATMTDEFFERQPAFLKTSESRRRFNWRFDTPEQYQAMVKGYFRMISGVDLVVGRIRQALADRGLADNTIIIYTSDNGYFLGDRGFADKWYLYEPSLRIPLLVYDPRHTADMGGRVCGATALNVDMGPTLLELAGVEVPNPMQGVSLMPLLRGDPPADWRTDFVAEHHFDHPRIPKSEGARTGQFTYINWYEQTTAREELYDHQADFEQVNNRVHDPEAQDTLNRLRSQARATFLALTDARQANR